jgi:predicted nucleotide-binding protein (sugar kinase/HSP70/actin superfamily)
MIYKEEVRDLFSVPEDYYLAHCISADFGMGKGIVAEFNKRFDLKNKLVKKYTNWLRYWDMTEEQQGTCILEGRVFNLITKRNYWNKPTYTTMERALQAMKVLVKNNGVEKIVMPVIGCGLDRLSWHKVSEQIKQIFDDVDIEILVCKQK